jgi:hypothetical protein
MTFRSELAVFLFVAAVVAVGCDKTAPAVTPPASPAASAVASSAGPVAETDGFKAELKPVGSYKKGEPATYEVILRAKAPYHVNGEYPAKFKATETAGVKYVEPKLERMKHPDAFTTEKCASGDDACTMTVTVKFTPEEAGTAKLGGLLDISVCDKDTCLIEKKQLEISAPVS